MLWWQREGPDTSLQILHFRQRNYDEMWPIVRGKKSKNPTGSLGEYLKTGKNPKNQNPQKMRLAEQKVQAHDQMLPAAEHKASVSRERVWELGAPDKGPREHQKQEVKNKWGCRQSPSAKGCIEFWTHTSYKLMRAVCWGHTGAREKDSWPYSRNQASHGHLVSSQGVAGIMARRDASDRSILPEAEQSPGHRSYPHKCHEKEKVLYHHRHCRCC